jgi:hypothetical protein
LPERRTATIETHPLARTSGRNVQKIEYPPYNAHPIDDNQRLKEKIMTATSIERQVDNGVNVEDIKALVAQSQKRSAVFDIVTNPTNVTVDVN